MDYDVIGLVLNYCDLSTLFNKCFYLNKTLKTKIETNAILKRWRLNELKLLIRCEHPLAIPIIENYWSARISKKCSAGNVTEIQKQQNIQSIFKITAVTRNTKVMKFLLENAKELIPASDKSFALLHACSKRNMEFLKLLIQDKRVDPSIHGNIVLNTACFLGKVELVKLLLQDERVDSSDNDCVAIKHACENGNAEIVSLLLQNAFMDPSANNNYSIIACIRHGYSNIFEMLLKDPRIDLHANNNQVLKEAIKMKKFQFAKLLLENKKQEITDQDKNSIFTLACVEYGKEIMKFLLDFLIDDPERNKNEGLFIAYMNHNREAFECLIKSDKVNPFHREMSWDRCIFVKKKNLPEHFGSLLVKQEGPRNLLKKT